MTQERIVYAVAGFFVMISVVLSLVAHPAFIYFTLFVGANLFQSAFTGFCPLTMILSKLGVPKCTQ